MVDINGQVGEAAAVAKEKVGKAGKVAQEKIAKAAVVAVEKLDEAAVVAKDVLAEANRVYEYANSLRSRIRERYLRENVKPDGA